jgi:curved DNA-binding protein CbpA
MQNDHYATLGVGEEADLESIKRRYRTLVRENHPDAVPTEKRDEAHQKMLALNAAWTVLSNPAARAKYDVTRRSEAVRVALQDAKKSRTATSTSTSSRAGAANARPATRARSAASTRSARSSTPTSSNPRLRLMAMLSEAEDLYFTHGLAAEAIALCERVRQFDPTNAEAAALLGDIWKEQGRRDLAFSMYEQAAKARPDNEIYARKLQNVRGAGPVSDESAGVGAASTRSASPPRRGPHAAKPQAPRAATDEEVLQARRRFTRPAVEERVAPEEEENSRNARLFAEQLRRSNIEKSRQATGWMLLGMATIALVFGALDEGSISISAIAPFSPRVMLMAGVAAALTGGALPLLGLVERAGRVRPGTSPLLGAPLLVCTLLVGLVAGPLTVPLLLLFGAFARSFSKSMLIVLLVAALLSCTMVFSVAEEQIPSALARALTQWSGRAVLPFLLFGWILGSAAPDPRKS